MSNQADHARSFRPTKSLRLTREHRVTAGIDWQPARDMNVYLRYIYFDYGDISADLDSGTAHMALAGATRTW
jgi:hypothetical protein